MTIVQRSRQLEHASWTIPAAHPGRAGWWTAYGLAQALPVVLLLRSWSSAFQIPLHFAALMLVAAVMVAVSETLRRTAHFQFEQRLTRIADFALLGSLSLSGLLTMLAVSTSGSSLPGLIIGWCLIVGVETSWWTRTVIKWRTPLRLFLPETHDAQLTDEVRASSPALNDEAVLAESLPDAITQQLTRRCDQEGREAVDGTLRVKFTVDERHRPVHVAFCPPLARIPDFHVEQIAGPEAKVEVSQLESFGVRLEVRLDRPAAQSSQVVIQFEAIV